MVHTITLGVSIVSRLKLIQRKTLFLWKQIWIPNIDLDLVSGKWAKEAGLVIWHSLLALRPFIYLFILTPICHRLRAGPWGRNYIWLCAEEKKTLTRWQTPCSPLEAPRAAPPGLDLSILHAPSTRKRMAFSHWYSLFGSQWKKFATVKPPVSSAQAVDCFF